MSNNTTDCFDSEEIYRRTVSVIIPVFGVIGHVLSIIVLRDQRIQSTTATYLVSLAVSESVYLTVTFVSFALPGLITAFNGPYMQYLNPVFYPLAICSQIISIYITVAFTAQRFFAIRWPLVARQWSTKRHTRMVIAGVILAVLIYSAPRFFELKFAYQRVECSTLIGQPRDFATTEWYEQTYKTHSFLVIKLLVPFTLLTVLNFLLVREVKRANLAVELRPASNQPAATEVNLTVTVIAVVVCFLLCQLPSIVLHFIIAVHGTGWTMASKANNVFYNIAVSLVSLNSAINFYLYCVFGRKFRKIFILKMRHTCARMRCVNRDGRFQETTLPLRNARRAEVMETEAEDILPANDHN